MDRVKGIMRFQVLSMQDDGDNGDPGVDSPPGGPKSEPDSANPSQVSADQKENKREGKEASKKSQ